MVQTELLCQIPERLLGILQQSKILGHMFINCSKEHYINMMVYVLGQIVSDDNSYFYSSHIFVTDEQKAEWLKCFKQTLDDLNVEDSAKEDLYHKLEKVVQTISVEESAPVCEYLSNAIEHSQNPDKLVHDLKSYLNTHPIP